MEIKIKTKGADKGRKISFINLIFGGDDMKTFISLVPMVVETGAFLGTVSTARNGFVGLEKKEVMYQLTYKFLSGLLAEDLETGQTLCFVDLESVELKDSNDETLYVPDSCLNRFRMHYINEPDLHMAVTEADYEKLAQHVRRMDKLDKIRDAIDYIVIEPGQQNIKKFLLDTIQKYPEEMALIHTPCTDGVDEALMLQRIISHFGGMATYSFVSYKGTEEEVKNTVLLMKGNADHLNELIRERKNSADIIPA